MLQSRKPRSGEDGYVLLVILFALTLLVIALAAAAPRATKAVQRTKEDELIRRGQQYALAIRRFYKRFGRYPTSVDQLENTNNIRFLRRRYLDPLTGKDDWQAIAFGQARPALGFFGQKVTTVGGQSPSGVGLGPSTIGTGQGGGRSLADTSTSGGGFSLSGSGGNGIASGSGANAGTTSGPSGGTGVNAPTGTAGNPISSDQLTGRTFGGGAIVGVSVPSQKESMKEYQQKDHYNEWQFVYDPTFDPTLRGGAGAGAATGIPGTQGAPGVPLNQGPGGLNNNSGNSIFGPSNSGSSSSGSSGSSSTQGSTSGPSTTPH